MGFKGQTRSAVGLAAFTLIGLVSLAPPVTMLTSAVSAAMQDAPQGSNDQPLWSPSGDRILFTKRHLAKTDVAKTEVYVMNADGGQPRRLTTEGKSGEPAWSPDGRRIAFVSVGDLYVMNADGS